MTKNETDSGSFITGFTLGIFAGAAGYFLFGTKKGDTLREKISKEWSHAKDTVIDHIEGDTKSSSKKSLQETLQKSWQSIIAAFEDTPSKTAKKSKTKKSRRKTASKSSKK